HDVKDFFAHAVALLAGLQPLAAVGAFGPIEDRGDLPTAARAAPSALKLGVVAEERRHRGEDIGGRRTPDRAQTGTAQGGSKGIHQNAANDVRIPRDPTETVPAICERIRTFASRPRRTERRLALCLQRFLQGVDDGPGPGGDGNRVLARRVGAAANPVKSPANPTPRSGKKRR